MLKFEMSKTSEWVSLGHPDKMADYISSYLLDECLKMDPNVRYAVEVQIKDNFVCLGGEVTIGERLSRQMIDRIVRQAVADIGYTNEYLAKWGAYNVPCADDLQIISHISQQSSNIAAGVDAGGWGDQGIFWGMAVFNTPDYMPLDFTIAKNLGYQLYRSEYGGIDIKTQVTMEGENVEELVVAIPVLSKTEQETIASRIKEMPRFEHCKLVINGTGEYTRHGSIGDCGTTGRKLAVDFYGGNCRIGGGSPWTKDGTKADLSLNLLARLMSVAFIKRHPDIEEVHCAISCKIGRKDIRVQLFDKHMNPVTPAHWIAFTPQEAIELFNLRSSNYAYMCRYGLFSNLFVNDLPNQIKVIVDNIE